LPRSYKQDEVKIEFSWKGAAIQRGFELGSRGIAIVRAITRQPLVKILWTGKDVACVTVICKV
jgi:hypothetical protein